MTADLHLMPVPDMVALPAAEVTAMLATCRRLIEELTDLYASLAEHAGCCPDCPC